MCCLSIINRLLLLVYTLSIMAALFVIGLAVAGWTAPVDLFQRYLTLESERLVIGIIIVVYLMLSIKFFLQALAGERLPAQAVVHETGLGQVRITSEAVENLVRRVVNQVRGITEVKPRVVCSPEGINIFVRVTLSPETNIPETSDEIQNKVGSYMAEVAGINIKTIKILVDGISSEGKTGAPRKLM